MKESDKEKREQQRHEKVEQALARAHAAQEVPDLSPRWVDSVMRDIRIQSSDARASAEAPILVWRAAAVIVVLSLALVGSALSWNAGQGDMPLSVLSEAMVDTTLLAGEL
jgi:hypothetical protein